MTYSPIGHEVMSQNSFNLLSEDHTDEEFLELFDTENLSLDSEYQASVKRIDPESSTVERNKAKAQYERESAAKLTKYVLEPTFTIPDTIRAQPITATASTTTSNDQPSQPITTPPLSKNKMKREQYKLTRGEIRRQRRPMTTNPHMLTP